MLGRRIKHRKGKIYHKVTDSFAGHDYEIVEREYKGNFKITPLILPYNYWVAYDLKGNYMRQCNDSAQFLHDEIEKTYAKRLMRKL